MRIALISDIHGNLEALTAVIADIRNRDVDRIACLGDIVGYGTNPNECVEAIMANCYFCIKGNHDAAILDPQIAKEFNDAARFAIDWTRNTLTQKSKGLMSSFPLSKEEGEFTAVHATPFRPHFWYYITSLDVALLNFNYFKTKFCFVGHTHIPGVIALRPNEPDVSVFAPKSFNYETEFIPSTKFIVNIGSVGQPRDKNPKSSYVILDTQTKEILFKRISYDIAAYQSKMRSAGMPKFLIDRIANGI